MKKILSTIIIISILISLVACGQKNLNSVEEKKIDEKNWEEILESAKGTTVNFYGWGGSEKVNTWLDKELANVLKEKYDINLNRVPMNIEDILNKLIGEKQTSLEDGTIDIVWINGENFYTAKQSQVLFGPFNHILPNFEKYIDKESLEIKYDFGFLVDGYEAPYGKSQFVMIGDQDKIKEFPKSHLELLELARLNKGKITYPAPPDFTGSAFVRNIIYETVGYERFIGMKPDKELIREEIKPAIDFLKELKPYLWREGKTYPSSLAQLDNMYSDEEVILTMNYNPMYVSSMIEEGRFKESSKAFLFEKGTIGNTHFLCIPYNSQNKEGSLVVINEILTPLIQSSKYDPINWGDLPVLDNSKLSSDEKKYFEDVDLGKGALTQSILLENRVLEMPADIVPIIEEIWYESILEEE